MSTRNPSTSTGNIDVDNGNRGDNNNNNEPSITMVQCEDCGHRLPEANMAIHRATCPVHRRERGLPPPQPSAPSPPSPPSVPLTSSPSPPPTMTTTTTATTTIHPEVDTGTDRGDDEEVVDSNRGEVIEAVEDSISGEYVVINPTEGQPSTSATIPPASATATLSTTTTTTSSPPQNHWACPRCTLHNPITSNTCDACLFQNNRPPHTNNNHSDHTNNNNNNQRMQVHIAEIDPLAAEAAGRAIGVAGWSLFGALVGGPIGAAVAGGSAAALAGVQHLQQRRRRRNRQRQLNDDNGGDNGNDADDNNNTNTGRRPFFTVTTTSYTTTPWGGTTMSVTSNASGQRRTVQLRDPDNTYDAGAAVAAAHGMGGMQGVGGQRRFIPLNRMNSTDRRMLRMILSSNAVRGGYDANGGRTIDELLQHFFSDEQHADPLRGRRGASAELIDRSSTCQTLETQENVDRLSEQQSTCNICLENFKMGDEMRILKHCSHAFHKGCIDRWLGQVASCPICKHELDNDSQSQQEQQSQGQQSREQHQGNSGRSSASTTSNSNGVSST